MALSVHQLQATSPVCVESGAVHQLADTLPARWLCSLQVRRTESKLMASSVSEAALASRVGDLTAFVEVLIHLCDDPREVSEVRASEASLRAQLQAVNAQLQVGRW